MSLRQDLATNVSPIFLRLVLGVTFLWAGLGKFMAKDFQITEQNAPGLVRSGILNEAEAKDLGVIPEDFVRDPFQEPASDDPDRESPSNNGDGNGSNAENGWGEDEARATDPASPRIVNISLPQDGDASADADDDEAEEELTEEEKREQKLKRNRVYGLSLMVYNAANPGVFTAAEADADDEDNIDDEDIGKAKMRLLPEALGKNNIPSYMGQAAAITEVVAGAFCLLGLLTRLSAFALVGVMGMATWLTTIGPAMQMQATRYGFLPNHETFDVGAWATFGWQLALLCAAFALLFSGPGTLSVDRIFGGGGGGGDYGDDDD